MRVAPSKFLAKQAVTKPEDAGLGLYAARAFKKEDVVISYYGRKIGPANEVGDEIRRLWAKGKGRHILRLGGDVTGMETDAAGYIGGCMNCSLNLSENNLMIKGGENGTLVALRDIKPGDELLFDYGSSYRRTLTKELAELQAASQARAAGASDGRYQDSLARK